MLPIRFINLDRAAERRAFMERQGADLGLDLERIRAVAADEIGDGERARLAASWERPLSGAELGCFLSHRGQWERIAREDRAALIVEDDAVFSRRLAAALPAAEAIQGIDLLNLEDFGKKRFLERGEGAALSAGVRRLRCRRDKAGTGAYLLWPSGARKLLAKAVGRAAPADAFLHGAGLAAFVCEPPLAMQADILAARGVATSISTASSIQAAGRVRRDPPRRGPRFLARRAAAQLKLLPHHLARLGRTDYRRVAFDEGDFI